MERIGILHPGAMGAFVAAAWLASGHEVCWASQGRGPATLERAQEHGLKDLVTVRALCRDCPVLVSVCPPHAAQEVAQAVAEAGFKGTYLDANAISPQRARRIEQALAAVGIDIVDGGIIGGPAWTSGRTRLYLSGSGAARMAELLSAERLEVVALEGDVGRASALKMVYAAYTKGTTALLASVVGSAVQLGVWAELEGEWARWGDFAQETRERLMRSTAKAWRFQGEMVEITETLESVGLPGGFHQAAGEIYRRLAPFKESPEPGWDQVMAALVAG